MITNNQRANYKWGEKMKSKDLENVIKTFVRSNHRSVLIDGPWGCGKTYQVKRYIEETRNTESKIHYISLFGIESIDEINTKLYQLIHPNLFKTKKVAYYGLNIISKAISPMPLVGGVSGVVDALGFAINDLPDKDISKNRIIVFDDLERVDSELSYIALLGYMNSLFLSQTRIMCLCSSDNIDDDKKDDFHDFKEKIFDRMHVIDESDEDIIRSYFYGRPIKNLSSMIGEFENNLRQAQKTASFFAEIIKYSEGKEYHLDDKITDVQLVRNCNQAIKICFSQNEKPSFSNKADDTLTYDFSYKQDVKAVGENIANGIHKLLRSKRSAIIDPTIQSYSENIIKGLIDIFLFKNYVLFDNTFKTKVTKISEEDFLDNEVFYLSDEGKENYANEFLERLYKGKIAFDRVNNQRFADILRYTNHQFSDIERTKIIDIMFEQSIDNVGPFMDVGDSIISQVRSVPGVRDYSTIEQWINGIDTKRKELFIKSKIEKLKSCYEQKTFTDMDLFVDGLEMSSITRGNSEIKDFIVNSDFLLPDLSESMTHSEWGYAHRMVKYAKSVGEAEKFINVAVKICQNNPNNNSLIERYDALIHYNIDDKINIKDLLQDIQEKEI